MKFRILGGIGQTIRAVATAIHLPGDVVVYRGFVGVYAGVINCAVGDLINVTIDAVGLAVTATGVTFAAGAQVFWNIADQTCVAAGGVGIPLLGTAVVAKVSGPVVTEVLLNRLPTVVDAT